MAIREVTYKEPAEYFNAEIRKAAEKWEKEHGKKPAAQESIDRVALPAADADPEAAAPILQPRMVG